jgi:predicted transcriptional regulator
MALLFQESRSNMCNLQQSPQQLLYNLYNSVAITELKGYAMMQFSWMLLRLYKKGMKFAQVVTKLVPPLKPSGNYMSQLSEQHVTPYFEFMHFI